MNHLIARILTGITIGLIATAGLAQDAKHPSHPPTTMVKAVPGYLISSFTIHDQATFQKYLDAVRPITTRYKGKAIAFNVSAKTVEGTPRPVMAVIEFPSYADVERFYFSPEYTEVRKLRMASTEGSVVLTKGFAPTQQ
jgi:uncharacterized protein (DUF1330 family)